MNDSKANAAHQQMLASIWASSELASGSVPSAKLPIGAGPSSIMGEIFATSQAAIGGDQDAAARMAAFRQVAATALGRPVDELPSVADLAAVQHGDQAAMLRFSQFAKKMNPDETDGSDSKQRASDSSANFAGFFPSLKRRLKRLDRMGAHIELESGRPQSATVIFLALLTLFLAPFALLALGLLLLLIGILMLASLTFMAIWMAFIHQLFVMFLHH